VDVWLDEAARLAASGVINNSRKSIDRGITIAGVMMGGGAVYNYAHDNAAVQFRSVDYTHSQRVLATFERFVAINSAIEVDSGVIGVYLASACRAFESLRLLDVHRRPVAANDLRGHERGHLHKRKSKILL
jgi:hypothetical protein